MRILHIESGRHLYGGGAQVRYLIEGLHAAGVDNVLVCARGGALAAAKPPATIVDMPMGGDLDAGLIARLGRTIRELRPDIVHVHSRRGADVFGGLAARLAGVPAVLTRRVDSAEPKLVARLKYRAYRRVIAISSAVAEQLAAAGVERGRIALIRSAVDTARFRPDGAARARLRDAFGLPADALAVGVVAQLIPRKGHHALLSELPAVLQREPRVRVIAFGQGPLESELRALAERLGVAAQVSFAGFRGDLPSLLPGLDVLVHPAERGRIALIRSAVDTARFRPDGAARARLLDAFGLPADALAVGVVAQLIPRKGHHALLSELPAVLHREPRVRVIAFGQGPLESELRALVERLGVAAQVSFAGFRGDLPSLLPGLDVLVHPAEREGLGVALLEAAAAGVPAIACAAGGVPEVVADGLTGLLVPPGDGVALRRALERLLADPELRRALGAAARTHVERSFSVAALAAPHVALYSEVLATGQAPAPRLAGGGWR